MTGLEKKSRVRECVAESPFCYRENCLLYIPENLKATLKGSREEVEQLAGQIRDLVCSTFGHTLVLFTSYAEITGISIMQKVEADRFWYALPEEDIIRRKATKL